MLLEGKIAIIHGAGGKIGGATARAMTGTIMNVSCGSVMDMD